MARKTKLTHARLQAWDKKYIWHPFTQAQIWEKDPTLIIESAKGLFLKDTKGKTYLDGVSSLWVTLFGHNYPPLNRAISKQLSKAAHTTFLGLSHPAAIELSRQLVKVAPKGLSRVFYSDSGSTSVEVALKMAYQYGVQSTGTKKKTEFLALAGSYHGDTIGSVSVGGIDTFHTKFRPLLFKSHFAMSPSCATCPFNKKKVRHIYRKGESVSKIPKPGTFRKETGCKWECLGSAQKIMKKRSSKLAGAVIEALVQGADGIRVMPPGYMAGFAKLCRQYKIPLIVDEVATGFGRTGTLFASEQENVNPDFLCVAKSLTGGYSPLAATLITEKVYKAFKGPVQEGKTFFHGHTYTAHPLGAAVALANLKLIKQTKLLEKTAKKAKLMSGELKALEGLSPVGSVRQAGLMVGIEIFEKPSIMKAFPASKRMGARICTKLLRHGIWLRPLGDTLVLMPPLTITASQIKWLVQSLKTVIVNECKT